MEHLEDTLLGIIARIFLTKFYVETHDDEFFKISIHLTRNWYLVVDNLHIFATH